MAENTSSSMPAFNDIMKQLVFDTPDEIAKKETGKKYLKKSTPTKQVKQTT